MDLPKATILHLPDEVKCIIFDHLDAASLFCMTMCSQYINGLVTPFLYRDIILPASDLWEEKTRCLQGLAVTVATHTVIAGYIRSFTSQGNLDKDFGGEESSGVHQPLTLRASETLTTKSPPLGGRTSSADGRPSYRRCFEQDNQSLKATNLHNLCSIFGWRKFPNCAFRKSLRSFGIRRMVACKTNMQLHHFYICQISGKLHLAMRVSSLTKSL